VDTNPIRTCPFYNLIVQCREQLVRMEAIMTKDILITITGKQQGVDENPVTIELPGSYHMANGKHYIQYDEENVEIGKSIRNMLKISDSHVTYSKRDAMQTRMEFEINETTQMNYYTNYGNLSFDINTSKIDIQEHSDTLVVKLEYTLTNNGAPVSENILHILVKART